MAPFSSEYSAVRPAPMQPHRQETVVEESPTMSDCPQWVQFKRPCGLGGSDMSRERSCLLLLGVGAVGHFVSLWRDGAVIEVCCLAVIGHLYKRGPSGRRRPK